MMEDEATQPATQIVIDPRRLGLGNSGLNDEDLADIFCILHPASPPAYRAAARVHESNPLNTISIGNEVKIRERESGGDKDVETAGLAGQGHVSCDIALRLSANLRDPSLGYLFGRNKQRCDFVIGRDEEAKRISNVHFRIYINVHGTIMLEDQSTNGTGVDKIMLRAKNKENGHDYRHTLEQGSIIEITTTPPEENFTFIVRIPQRDGDSETTYQENLRAYFLRINEIQLERQARGATTADGVKREPLNLFPIPENGTTPNLSAGSVGRYVKEWRGGTKYNKVQCIGKGAFAVVYKVTTKFEGIPYAAKELEKRRFMKNGVLDQKVDTELKIMQKIKHPSIVQYIEHIDWEEYLYIIMEYVSGGDLGTLILERHNLPELTVKTMASQLLSALKYLHEMNITHRDIKPDNILIFDVNPFQVKLTDFGLSKMIDTEETFLRTFCGTLLYCAPEVYSEYREYDETGRRSLRGVDKKTLPQQRYDHEVDIWSLAGVLFYALCGSPPYPAKSGTSHQELLNHIMSRPLDIRPLQRKNVSDGGIRFVRSMLHIRPQCRARIPELELSSWLTGDSMAISIAEDEVDMIGDGFVDVQLEGGTSQLSIREPHCHQVDNMEGSGLESMSDVTEMQPPEIRSSFNTSSGNSNENESYGFMPPRNPGNGRLFGEFNISDLGSSGAIPMHHLNLPVPTLNQREINASLKFVPESMHTQRDPAHDSSQIGRNSQQPNPNTAATIPIEMPPPPPPQVSPHAINNLEFDERSVRSSSLMGTESMVGHLNMHSPSSTSSPAADTSTRPTADAQATTISLRRPRDADIFDDEDWRPFDLPSKRRRKSEREIDMPVPPSIFWDPRDRSTHHNNYPRMSVADFQAYEEYAKTRGEKFEPGGKTFEMTMRSFRSSRSPSVEPEASTRAHSEPTKDGGRRLLMKRDDRSLGGELVDENKTMANSDLLTQGNFTQAVVHNAKTPITGSSVVNVDTNKITNKMSNPVVGNDFQPPKRILAKVVATPDSTLPTLTLNITESLTSWGRGYDNTLRYSNSMEVQIPRYAFKLMLFKPTFNSRSSHSGLNAVRNGQPWNQTNGFDRDMAFYISSKASTGIWINGINLPSHDIQNPLAASKFWGELRHGDFITVWHHDIDKRQFTRFRFECFWGKSMELRKENDMFRTVQEGHFLADLERTCLVQEYEILQDQKRQKEEETRILEREKEKEKKAHEDGAAPQVNSNEPSPPMTD